MLTRWFIFSVVVIALFAIISNTSPAGITAIENQIFLMNCPFPISGGIANNTNIDGLTVTYDLVRDDNLGTYRLTVFDCGVVDPDIPTYSASTTVYTATVAWYDLGFNYLAYLMHVISEAGFKIQSFFILIGYLLTPINFNILGFTIDDISGTGLIIIIFMYLICYVGIALFLWKALNPFGGSV